MCGIFGVYNLQSKSSLHEQKFQDSLLTMKYRGPDAHASKVFNDQAILGHLRLSIIDLNSKSNQPFELDDRYWIVFNGEIYNYIELREELIHLGHTFRTDSDTEVLLRAFQHWGEECVKRFNGMWSFAIYDNVQKYLFCSRDRFGVKPFNYAVHEEQFIFSSEVKAILNYFPSLKEPNYNVISNYCRTSIGAQHRETWFKDVYRLEPGHNLSIQNGEIKKYRYWKYPSVTIKTITFNEAVDQYKALFFDALSIRMRSDVPVGTTLSSGLDSASIVCSLREFYHDTHYTFTARFMSDEYSERERDVYKDKDIEIDEAALVKKLANYIKVETNFIDSSYENFIPDLQEIIYHLESGHSSSAIFPLTKVMEEATKKVTVVLEGQGADEALGGYVVDMIGMILVNLVKMGQWKKAQKTLSEFRKNYSAKYAAMMSLRYLSNKLPFIHSFYRKISNLESIYDKKLASYQILKDYPDIDDPMPDDPINLILRQRHSGGLVNLLHYGDAISMASSLESRLPFMDYRLVEFAFQLPWEYKVHYATGKYIHRQAMKGILPDFIANNPIKFGFNTPVSQFFKKSCALKIKPIDILLSEECINRGLFKKDALIRIINEHDSDKKNHSSLLFRLLSVELWFRNFIDEPELKKA
jgi:asparagine synthase (glutamine-hydrolysing)